MRRCKKICRIPFVPCVADKKTGGYFNGQELIFRVVVTEMVTFPVGFCFYTPDPFVACLETASRKKMKQQGILQGERPKRPEPNPNYPTKPKLTVQMIKNFVHTFPNIFVPAVLADALYGDANFMVQVQTVLPIPKSLVNCVVIN